MDDILFRHTAIATPNSKDEAFLQRIEQSDAHKTMLKAAKQFDADLEKRLKIEVPAGLADKILLEQSFAVESKRAVSGRWHIAIAASIAFIIGISLPLLTNLSHSPLDIGEVAMQHVKAEYYFTAKSHEQADLPMINAKLARYGAKAHQGLGEITFLNYCDFEGTPALHMVMKGKKGQITVFVVPEDANFIETEKFNNQYLKGVTEKMGNANVVIVGERAESLTEIQAMMQNNIQWNI